MKQFELHRNGGENEMKQRAYKVENIKGTRR